MMIETRLALYPLMLLVAACAIGSNALPALEVPVPLVVHDDTRLKFLPATATSVHLRATSQETSKAALRALKGIEVLTLEQVRLDEAIFELVGRHQDTLVAINILRCEQIDVRDLVACLSGLTQLHSATIESPIGQDVNRPGKDRVTVRSLTSLRCSCWAVMAVGRFPALSSLEILSDIDTSPFAPAAPTIVPDGVPNLKALKLAYDDPSPAMLAVVLGLGPLSDLYLQWEFADRSEDEYDGIVEALTAILSSFPKVTLVHPPHLRGKLVDSIVASTSLTWLSINGGSKHWGFGESLAKNRVLKRIDLLDNVPKDVTRSVIRHGRMAEIAIDRETDLEVLEDLPDERLSEITFVRAPFTFNSAYQLQLLFQTRPSEELDLEPSFEIYLSTDQEVRRALDEALCEGLRSWKGLKRLYIRQGWNWSPAGLAEALPVLSTLQVLSVHSLDLSGPDPILPLSLEVLRVWEVKGASKPSELTKLRNLQELRIYNEAYRVLKGISFQEVWPGLTKLYLHTNDGARFLLTEAARHGSLLHLTLSVEDEDDNVASVEGEFDWEQPANGSLCSVSLIALITANDVRQMKESIPALQRIVTLADMEQDVIKFFEKHPEVLVDWSSVDFRYMSAR